MFLNLFPDFKCYSRLPFFFFFFASIYWRPQVSVILAGNMSLNHEFYFYCLLPPLGAFDWAWSMIVALLGIHSFSWDYPHKPILQTRMHSHLVGLYVRFLVGPFVFSILHVCEQRRLWRDCPDAQARLSLRWSRMWWAGSKDFILFQK